MAIKIPDYKGPAPTGGVLNRGVVRAPPTKAATAVGEGATTSAFEPGAKEARPLTASARVQARANIFGAAPFQNPVENTTLLPSAYGPAERVWFHPSQSTAVALFEKHVALINPSDGGTTVVMKRPRIGINSDLAKVTARFSESGEIGLAVPEYGQVQYVDVYQPDGNYLKTVRAQSELQVAAPSNGKVAFDAKDKVVKATDGSATQWSVDLKAMEASGVNRAEVNETAQRVVVSAKYGDEPTTFVFDLNGQRLKSLPVQFVGFAPNSADRGHFFAWGADTVQGTPREGLLVYDTETLDAVGYVPTPGRTKAPAEASVIHPGLGWSETKEGWSDGPPRLDLRVSVSADLRHVAVVDTLNSDAKEARVWSFDPAK